MGLEDEEDTCDSFPLSLSPHYARGLWAAHSFHPCPAAAVARAVLDGARNRAWDDVDSLITPQDWVAAYEARHLLTAIGDDGCVELVAYDAMTAVLMPHALAAWVYDWLGFQTPTLAPALGQLSVADWAFLTKPDVVPVKALEELRRAGVTILEPGQRLSLPMTPTRHAVGQSWWHEWPQQHVRYPQLLGTPPMMVLLNLCFWAAHSLHKLSRSREEIQFEVLPGFACQSQRGLLVNLGGQRIWAKFVLANSSGVRQLVETADLDYGQVTRTQPGTSMLAVEGKSGTSGSFPRHFGYAHWSHIEGSWQRQDSRTTRRAERHDPARIRAHTPLELTSKAILPNSHITVTVNAEAAAGIRKREVAMSRHTAASQLIAVGARVVEAAGRDGRVLVRDAAGTERVVEIDDALMITVSGRWPIEYEVYRR